MRVKFTLSYDGTDFCGWQAQLQGERTVQGEIQSILSTLYNQPIEIVGCGRTDTGVHAKYYVAHCDLLTYFSLEQLTYKMNKMLDADIVIHMIEEVNPDFHARYDAISRCYEYQLRLDKDPFDQRFTWQYPYNDELNLTTLNQAASLLLQFEDFFAFSKTDTDVNTYICYVREAAWSYNKFSGVYTFRIISNRFLRGMIRLLVGATLNINRGKLSFDDLHDALTNKKRLPLDWSVPGKGLCLREICY